MLIGITKKKISKSKCDSEFRRMESKVNNFHVKNIEEMNKMEQEYLEMSKRVSDKLSIIRRK